MDAVQRRKAFIRLGATLLDDSDDVTAALIDACAKRARCFMPVENEPNGR